MDNRRRNGLIALVILVTAVVALVYYQIPAPPSDPTTAFAPAQSADESVAPADAPIVPPADMAAIPDPAAEVPEAALTAEEAAADASGADAPAELEPMAEAESQVAMMDPAADASADPDVDNAVAPAAPSADADGPPIAVPTFDVVRVEPSGDTVIAGQAEPNATIEIMDGPTVIATAEANAAGEWVIALDQPLEPGTHDLGISTTTADEAIVTLSDERVTVSVPDAGSSDVLVVLNAPDAPTTVLQLPPAATPPPDQEVALAEPQGNGLAIEPTPGQDVVVAEPPLDAPDGGLGGEDIASVTPQEPAAVEPGETMAGEVAEASQPAEEMAIASAPQAVEPGVSAPESAPAVAFAEQEPDETGTDDAATADASATEPQSEAPAAEVASDQLPAAEPEQQVAMMSPTEEPDVEDAVNAAEGGSQQAADSQSTPVEADVAAETPTQDDSAAEPEVETAMTEPAVEDEPPAPLPPTPLVTVSAVEADTTGALYVAGVAATGEPVRVYIDGEYIDDARPSPSGTWLVETIMDLPAGQYVIRVDQVAADGSVIARYEVPFDREVEVAILKPVGATASADSATLSGAMPEVDTVIIKRGDNLWRIARATWGKGIRWSTIYQANSDQIRNPNRIYPGQVFMMPKGDATWEN